MDKQINKLKVREVFEIGTIGKLQQSVFIKELFKGGGQFVLEHLRCHLAIDCELQCACTYIEMESPDLYTMEPLSILFHFQALSATDPEH